MSSSSSFLTQCHDDANDSASQVGSPEEDEDSPLFEQSYFFIGHPTPVYLNPDKRKSSMQVKRSKDNVIFCLFCQRIVTSLYLEYFCTWECGLSHYRTSDPDYHRFICNEVVKAFPPGYLPKPIILWSPKDKSIEEFWETVLSSLYPPDDPRNFDLSNRFKANACDSSTSKIGSILKKTK